MKEVYNILVINFGSTSTKIAFYENELLKDEKTLEISREEIAQCKSVFDQYAMRRRSIEEYAEGLGMKISDFSFIVSRGCGGGNQKAGGYIINQALVDHCHNYKTPHISSLGPVVTYDLMKEYGIPGYIYDSEGVNEFNKFAVLSGLKEFPVDAGCHTLNAKAAARKAAATLGGQYCDYNLIVCHMGGGVSTSAHDHGILVDSTSDAYAPERSGGMPMLGMVRFTRACFSGEYNEHRLLKMQTSGGGLMSYLGTSDLREVERRIDGGDSEAEYYFDGMVYQLAKDIGGMAAVLSGKVDGIVFTGGMAYSGLLVERLKARVEFIAPVLVIAGSHEMEALVLGALRVTRGEEAAHEFGTER